MTRFPEISGQQPTLEQRTNQDARSRGLDRRARMERANSPIGRLLRYTGLLIGVLLGWQVGLYFAMTTEAGQIYPVFVAALLGALGFLVTPYAVFGLIDMLHVQIRRLTLEDLTAVTVGLLIGGVLSALLAWPLSFLPRPAGQIIPAVVAVLLTLGSATAMLAKRDELFAALRRGQDSAPIAPVVLDTSAIIDGRVREIARSGFLEGQLVVPQFALHELQQLAEGTDPGKQARGRRGLELLRQLRQDPHIDLVVCDLDPPGTDDVDQKLLRTTQELGGRLLTCDQNLAQIAMLSGITVLNPNTLERALRPPIHPGDEFQIRVVGEGREPGQGVGYLEDGTMVVIEAGQPYVGQEINVTVTRTLQTAAGRMVFAQARRSGQAA